MDVLAEGKDEEEVSNLTFDVTRVLELLPQNLQNKKSARTVNRLFLEIRDLCEGNDFVKKHIFSSLNLLPLNDRTLFVIQNVFSLFQQTAIEGTSWSSIPRALTRALEEERGDLVCKAAILMKGVASMKNKGAVLLRAIRDVPASRRDDVMRCSTLFINATDNGCERDALLHVIGKLPEEIRKQVLQKAKALLSLSSQEGLGQAALIEELGLLIKGKKEEVIEDATPFLKELSGYGQAAVLRAVQYLPHDRKESILARAIVLMKKPSVIPSSIYDALLQVTSQIAEEQWVDVIEKGLPLLEIAEEKWTELLVFMGSISKEQRNLLMESMRLLLQGVDFDGELFEVAEKMDPTQREDVIRKSLPLLRRVANKEGQISILKAVLKISEEERESLVCSVMLFLQEDLDEKTSYEYLFQALYEIPEGERADVIQKTLLLIHNKRNQSWDWSLGKQGWIPLLKTIYRISLEQREDVTFQANILLQTLSLRKMKKESKWQEEGWTDILIDLEGIPQSQRGNLILSVDSLLQSFSFTKKMNAEESDWKWIVSILERLRVIPEQQRDEVIKSAKSLVKVLEFVWQKERGDAWNWDNNGMDSLLEAIYMAPSGQRERLACQVIRLFKTEIRGREDWNGLSVLMARLLYFLSAIDPKRQESIASCLTQDINLLHGKNIYFAILQKQPDLWVASHDHLLSLFDAGLLDPVRMRKWALFILEKQALLSIPDEHPLIVKSLELLDVTEFEGGTTVVNPYKIYHSLALQEPFWQGSMPSFTLGTFHIEVNLNSLRKQAQNKELFLEDLPRGIASSAFHSLFTHLDEHLQAQPLLIQKIEETYGMGIKELKQNLLQGELLIGLLHKPEVPKASISKETYYMYAILKFILSQDAAYVSVEQLSSQEKFLLNFASVVTSCKIGQLDGIAYYYNDLPLQYRTFEKAKTTTEQTLKGLIEASMQSTLQKMFYSEDLIRSLAEQEQVGEQSHQSLYLKNRLHKQVGLKHSLVFDPHAGLIHPTILGSSLDRLMKGFFSFCSPHKFISQLQEDVQKGILDFYIPISERLDYLSQQKKQLKENLLRNLNSLTQEEQETSLGEYLRTISAQERDSFLTLYSYEVLQVPIKSLIKNLSVLPLIRILRSSNASLSPFFQELFDDQASKMRGQIQELINHLGFLENHTTYSSNGSLVQDLRSLESEALSQSVEMYRSSLERRRMNCLIKQHFEALNPGVREKPLREFTFEYLSFECREYLNTFSQLQSIKRHLERLSSVPSLSSLEVSLCNALQGIHESLGKKSLRKVLGLQSSNPMDHSVREYLNSSLGSNLSRSLKETFRFYLSAESYAGYTLQEILRDLSCNQDIGFSKMIIEWLCTMQNPKHRWITYDSNEDGMIVPQLSYGGALTLLEDAGCLQTLNKQDNELKKAFFSEESGPLTPLRKKSRKA